MYVYILRIFFFYLLYGEGKSSPLVVRTNNPSPTEFTKKEKKKKNPMTSYFKGKLLTAKLVRRYTAAVY